ncbi:hypothetical protein M1E08_06935 [Erwinia sp. PK3-005]|nr:hypothetical protein [Mixta hanseatica]
MVKLEDFAWIKGEGAIFCACLGGKKKACFCLFPLALS